MKTEKNIKPGKEDLNNKIKQNTNTVTEAKVIPLQPTDSATLADQITVSSENEDILTPVKNDNQDY